MTTAKTRRDVLSAVAAVAGAAAVAQLPADRGAAAPRPPGAYPFPLGVASGDPTAAGAVLWTRLVPRPFEPGGMPAVPVPASWEVAADERFGRVVRRGVAWALPRLAHSVHVEVDGLRADREWFYRFRYGSDVSPVGRTRTAPAAGTGTPLEFAFASRSDPDLQAAHARFPWAVTWDDHEVQNDYANTQSQYEGDISALRAAAYQAWYEHQPVRAPARRGQHGQPARRPGVDVRLVRHRERPAGSRPGELTRSRRRARTRSPAPRVGSATPNAGRCGAPPPRAGPGRR